MRHTALRLTLVALLAACSDGSLPTTAPSTRLTGVFPGIAADFKPIVLVTPAKTLSAELKGVNANRDVIGYLDLAGSGPSFARWDANGVYQSLSFPGLSAVDLVGIDDIGTVVVNGRSGGRLQAFIQTSPGQVVRLPAPSGMTVDSSLAYFVSPAGHITGVVWNKGTGFPVYWRAGSYRAMRLATAGARWNTIIATGINASGQVTGTGRTGSMAQAFVWDSLSAPGPRALYRTTWSEALGISDARTIVGRAVVNSDTTVVQWPNGQSVWDVNSFGTVMSVSVRISPRGRLIGTDQGITGASTVAPGKADYELLPPPPGATNMGAANAVNACGDVAGGVLFPNGVGQRPVLWVRTVCD